MKITESATSKTDTVSEKSSRQQMASETYRKVKEVEYRKETIYDKNGMEITYDVDPNEYKKARKRIQNRESAVRSRTRKKWYFTELELRVEYLEEENKRLSTANATLSAEKKLLSEQLDYFKALVGNMNQTFSTRTSNITHTRENSYQGEAYDGVKDVILEPYYDIKDGELPHLGNYKRPMGTRMPALEDDDERLVLSRRNENTLTSTAGLFFVAIVMWVLCFTSLTMTGSDTSDQEKKEFSLENPSRHMMAIQKKQEETTSFLRVMMWLIFLLSIVLAYISRITFQEGKLVVKTMLVRCRIIKDTLKKTKYS